MQTSVCIQQRQVTAPQKSVKIAWSGVASFFARSVVVLSVVLTKCKILTFLSVDQNSYPAALLPPPQSTITGIVMQEGFYAIMTEATKYLDAFPLHCTGPVPPTFGVEYMRILASKQTICNARKVTDSNCFDVFQFVGTFGPRLRSFHEGMHCFDHCLW